MLWEGITKVYPEGPHIYKKDSWYYFLIAEGGCFADLHTITARSRDIWGPYEVNPANPVLAKADPNGYFQYTGHENIFQDPSGQWYFVCLGVRKNDGRSIMGDYGPCLIAEAEDKLPKDIVVRRKTMGPNENPIDPKKNGRRWIGRRPCQKQ